jgi:hypothetical protein
MRGFFDKVACVVARDAPATQKAREALQKTPFPLERFALSASLSPR